MISLHCPHEETLHSWLSKMSPVKILMRLAWMARGTFSEVAAQLAQAVPTILLIGTVKSDQHMYHNYYKYLDILFTVTTYRSTLPNYRTYPYKRTVKQFRSLQITVSVLFVCFFVKAYVVGTIQMSTHNIICFYKENQKKIA